MGVIRACLGKGTREEEEIGITEEIFRGFKALLRLKERRRSLFDLIASTAPTVEGHHLCFKGS